MALIPPPGTVLSGADGILTGHDEDARIPRTLRGRLQQRLDGEISALAANVAKTFDDYRFRTGRIAALREAIADCEKTERDLLG